MISTRSYLLSFSALLLFTGCTEKASTLNPFSGKNAFQEVEALLNYSPRDAGTAQGHRAALHLSSRLDALGIDNHLDYFTDMTPEGPKDMVNVMGHLRGDSNEWIILASHFDTMPGIDNFYGANDSGSSSGVLIDLARVLKQANLLHNVLLVFFDGEEGIANYIPGDGLHGSRYLATKIYTEGARDRYKAMILLDMVGDRDLTYTIPVNSSPHLMRLLEESADELDLSNFIEFTDLYIIDDHVPFQQIGIPAIDLIDFYYGSRPGENNYWHTDYDDLDHISTESLQISGDITLRILKKLGVF
jgi:Zn-dependent M28 family amino/carboxypeptidase